MSDTTTYDISLRLKSIQGPRELRALAKDAITTLEARDREMDKLRDEVEQYKLLLEQAKTLRQDNIRMREALKCVRSMTQTIAIWWHSDIEEMEIDEWEALEDAIGEQMTQALNLTQQDAKHD